MMTNLKKHPALFIGHGSPMNILAENRFTHDLIRLRDQLFEPQAILVISAHWLTSGTRITASAMPEQIYDFHGFPHNLYKFRYQAPGSPDLAKTIADLIGNNVIYSDLNRGIDHAAWAVLKHVFPEQKIPVLELSLDVEKEPAWHFELGQKLAQLRDMNILVIGSGNIIHNLRDIDFRDDAPPFGWATEFDITIKEALVARDFAKLIDYNNLGPSAGRAIPFNDHYLPLLYTLGMVEENETVWFIHESIQNGSISMRSFITL
jgi:4,5-DOPA dioxygenase extradiol